MSDSGQFIPSRKSSETRLFGGFCVSSRLTLFHCIRCHLGAYSGAQVQCDAVPAGGDAPMVTSAGSLTAVAIRNAKPGPKPQRLFDGGGMYLEVMPNGSRYWRLKYRFAGKEKRLALGVYPEVSLADARGLRDDARAAMRVGRDPSADRKTER